MGYEVQSLKVTWHVSRHNSPRDDADDQLAAQLAIRIRQIVEDPVFDRLDPMMD